ncbi:hypothetical protein NHQ30_006493 [Ciborinia camelliae]|nr:hypothetical protein NHQ30_006493 [Ciborinia camelliae]
MVKFSSIALFLIATVGVQACTYCQCEFRGGQPCCVTPITVRSSAPNNNVDMDCHAICLTARRDDGTKWLEDLTTVYGTRCNGAGNYQCINQFQMQGRVKCVNPNAPIASPAPKPSPTPIHQ